MRFDSYVFAVFFVTVFLAYWRLRSIRAQNILILVASYFFYGWWDWRFLTLIALSTLVDFLVGRRLDVTSAQPTRRRLLLVSIVVNLGVLGVFKYFDFFVSSFVGVLESFGLSASPPVLQVLLPVGISFYTFQTMGYTIDIYRRRHAAEKSLLSFACYVAFFPQLVAGPIERAARLLPQFGKRRFLTSEHWRSGCTLVTYGLIKKIAIADNMAPYVDMVYGMDSSSVSGPLVLAGTLAFAIQIYADFSGYTDIARGVARLMGFDLRVNFNKPYVARTPSEFWRRWHISLSTWLRDYLYVPLGGNRRGRWMTYRNLMLTMLLGGLWHGAAWNFVLWGFFHGVILCIYRLIRVDAWLRGANRAVSLGAAALFFLLTLYGWLLFRAQSFEQIADFTLALGTWWTDWSLAIPMITLTAYFTLPIAVHHLLSRGKGGEKWAPANPLMWRISLGILILFGVIHARASGQAFIYFQF